MATPKGDKMKINPEILLHPNIPKPLHGMSPRVLFGKEWWDKKRQIAYAERDYHCWACGVHKTEAKYHQWLEAHECYSYNYKKCTLTMKEIVALCHSCHSYIHSGRLEVMRRKGEVSEAKFKDIHAHGNRVLESVIVDGFKNPYIINDEYGGDNWSKWKMIIDGKKYKAKFKSYDEWYEFYNKGKTRKSLHRR